MQDAPIDPSKTTSYRLLLAVVIFLGALIVIALGVLVVGLVMKFNVHAPAEADEGGFTLPPGAEIVHTDMEPGRLILHIHTKEGEEIDIIDTRKGRLVARVKPQAAK